MKSLTDLIPRECMRYIAKEDATSILSDLDNKIRIMQKDGYSKEKIISKINDEINSLQPFFKLKTPYNKELSQSEYVYKAGLLKLDTDNFFTFISDFYFVKSKKFRGVAIKYKNKATILKENIVTKQYKVEKLFDM